MRRFWPVKFLLWGAPLIGVFFMPVSAFQSYWIVSFVFACFFIMLQSVLLIDFAWEWSQHWVDQMESHPTSPGLYKFLLIGSTIIAFCFVFVVTVLLYVYFVPSKCQLNAFFVTFNLILTIAFTVISIMETVREKNPRAGLFQSAILAVYTTYLTGMLIFFRE